MKPFTIWFNSGQTGQWTLDESSKFKSFKVSDTDQNNYQSGRIGTIVSPPSTPTIGDDVYIEINNTGIFSGYVQNYNVNWGGDEYYDLQLVGKNQDLWNYFTDDLNSLSNDYTSNFVYDLVSANTNLGYSSIPRDSGAYLTGNYDFSHDTVGNAVKKVSQWDDYNFRVGINDSIQYYKPAGSQKTIDESDVVSMGKLGKTDRNVYNVIKVIGSGNISYTAKDTNSINTYGKKTKKITDLSIPSGSLSGLANSVLDEYKTPSKKGSLTIRGDESLTVESKISSQISDIGFSGLHEIKSLSHTYQAGTYANEISFGETKFSIADELQHVKRQSNSNTITSYDAIKAASSAQATADGKIATFYQSSQPVAESSNEGDIWFDIDDGRHSYIYSSNSWVNAYYTKIDEAMTSANNAYDYAGTKVVTFFQNNVPTASGTGDLWVDTDNDYKMYRASSAGVDSISDTGWVESSVFWNGVQDDGDKPEDNATSNEVFYDTTVSNITGMSKGDIALIDSDGDGTFDSTYTYNGSSWLKGSDLTRAFAKDITHAQSTEPSDPEEGWVWLDTDTGELFRYNGSNWNKISDITGQNAQDFTWIIDNGDKPEDNADVTKQHTADINYASSTAPSSPNSGWYWLDTSTDKLKRYNGSSWITQVDLTGSNPQDFSWVVDDGTKPENNADVTKYHSDDVNHIGGSAPSSPQEGWLWLDTSLNPDELKKYNGLSWDTVGTVEASWSAVVNDGGKPVDNATKNVDYVQSAEPTGTSGDLWIDTDDNTPYIHDGSAWQRVTWDKISLDPNAPSNNATVNDAFVQSTKPTDTSSGNLWIDSDTNTPYIADGSNYHRVSWADISSDANAPEDNADITKQHTDDINHTGDTAPANPQAGWYWLDTSVNKLKRYNGASWVVQSDITSSNAQDFSWVIDNGNKPEDNADITKNHTNDINHTGSTAPSSPQAGWYWLDISTDKLKRYNGSSWDIQTDLTATNPQNFTWVVDGGSKPEDNADVTKVHASDVNYIGDSPPSSPQSGWMWLDTSTNPDKLKKYNGSSWDIVGTVDASWSGVVDNGSKPEDNADVTKYHTSDINHIGDSAPSSPQSGWLWLDTSTDPDELKKYNGSSWDTIGTVHASWSQVVDDGGKPVDNATKNVDFVQSTEPIGAKGDLWIDTDDNTPFIHDGTDWRRVSWSRISLDSNAPADNATVNDAYIQSSEPTDTSEGNLWIDSDNNTPHVADGSSYQRVSWASISSDSSAPEDNADVTSLHADDINHIGSSAPSSPEMSWLWLDTSTSPDTLKKYNGSDWDTVGTVDSAWSGVVNDDGNKPDDNATKNETVWSSSKPDPANYSSGDIWVDSDTGTPWIHKNGQWNKTSWKDIDYISSNKKPLEYMFNGSTGSVPTGWTVQSGSPHIDNISDISGLSPLFGSNSLRLGDNYNDGEIRLSLNLPGKVILICFYYAETTNNNELHAEFYNENGNKILGVYSDNPQWMVEDSSGTTELNDGNENYKDWHYVIINFDLESESYDLYWLNKETGLEERYSGDLINSASVIKHIDFWNGSYNDEAWIDGINRYYGKTGWSDIYDDDGNKPDDNADQTANYTGNWDYDEWLDTTAGTNASDIWDYADEGHWASGEVWPSSTVGDLGWLNEAGSGNITANSVFSSQLAPESIYSGQISTGALNANHIAANAITTNKIHSNAVMNTKIGSSQIYGALLSGGCIYSIHLSGTTGGGGAVNYSKMSPSSIRTDILSSNAVDTQHVQASSINGNQIIANELGVREIKTSGIMAENISSNAIAADKILANAVTTNKIKFDQTEPASPGSGSLWFDEGSKHLEISSNSGKHQLAYGADVTYDFISGNDIYYGGKQTTNVGITQSGDDLYLDKLVFNIDTTDRWTYRGRHSEVNYTNAGNMDGNIVGTVSQAHSKDGTGDLVEVLGQAGGAHYLGDGKCDYIVATQSGSPELASNAEADYVYSLWIRDGLDISGNVNQEEYGIKIEDWSNNDGAIYSQGGDWRINNGNIIPDSNYSNSLGTSSKHFGEAYISSMNVGDINMENDWTFTESEEHGVVLENPKGKKFKFELTEIAE